MAIFGSARRCLPTEDRCPVAEAGADLDLAIVYPSNAMLAALRIRRLIVDRLRGWELVGDVVLLTREEADSTDFLACVGATPLRA